MTTVQIEIKQLELEKLKLFGKGMKMFAGSKKHREIQSQLSEVFAKIYQLKSISNETI